MNFKVSVCSGILFLTTYLVSAQTSSPTSTLFRPTAVFDGEEMHPGWSVLVTGDKIAAAGPASEISAPPNARTIELPNETLLPGMIEGHSHLFLHPYNEASWNDQVTNESL
jgi:imidazolonepropionase-like amidohydrolase